ncbi:MAG: hypothetical protein H2172_00760 [Opitutus sp.]|nr:hypothetical protein [Opitutus sp.]MCS6246253.1 hypothetical protein [Opitutus sp.]MCS6274118.1 hypothetical protein [Opitutus sp.]MCS6277260.1 hypothetical protein [Opitutus sp.]MCS6300382.1 hypothetical protein [Opitutus sp.]
MTTTDTEYPFFAACALISEGDSVSQACKTARVARRTFFKRLAEAGEGDPLRHHYARARAARADSRSDDIEEFVRRACLRKDDPEYLDPNAARVAIDAIKWLAGKENSAKYGDKVTVEAPPKPAATREDHLRIVQESGIDIAAILECYALPAP